MHRARSAHMRHGGELCATSMAIYLCCHRPRVVGRCLWRRRRCGVRRYRCKARTRRALYRRRARCSIGLAALRERKSIGMRSRAVAGAALHGGCAAHMALSTHERFTILQGHRSGVVLGGMTLCGAARSVAAKRRRWRVALFRHGGDIACFKRGGLFLRRCSRLLRVARINMQRFCFVCCWLANATTRMRLLGWKHDWKWRLVLCCIFAYTWCPSLLVLPCATEPCQLYIPCYCHAAASQAAAAHLCTHLQMRLADCQYVSLKLNGINVYL